MKREAGFTLIEVMVATAIMIVILAATVSALTDAVRATQAVTLMADTQENLRAGMNYVVRDISQAGEGIPNTGVTIPSSGVNWPATGIKFSTSGTNWTALPAISPGYRLGPTTGTSGNATDVVTIVYADNTLLDTTFTPAHWLNEFPVNLAASCPNGLISTSGTAPSITVTAKFDGTNCVNINTGNTGLAIGDLILLQNNASTCGGGNSVVSSAACDSSAPGSSMALRVVTAINTGTNTITMAPGDAFGLNGGAIPTGTITASRLWMITYYINNSNTARPQLMREVNLNGAYAVGDVLENLQVFYDIVSPGSNPPSLAAEELENPTFAQLPYIRDAYIFLFARSENKFLMNSNYVRNNLESVVSVRGLSFYNEYN
jgi:prepilin-type N-terminal cleavage/methylation domain-containing protein